MSTEEKISTWIDKQSETPYPIWALSAASIALLPLAVKKSPGVPSMFQTMAFAGIFGGAGYVTNAGDSENGAGIATAWCLSWSFLNAKSAIKSMRPVPMVFLAAVTLNTVIYGKKTLKLDYYGSLAWDFFQDNDSKFLYDLERSIKCCGYADVRDRAVPKTCSASLGVDTGCRESIVSVVQDQWVTMGILCLLSIQLIALFVSVILSIIMDRETREEETYMALLSSQHNNSWLGNGESSYIGNSGYFGRTNRTSQRSIPKMSNTTTTSDIPLLTPFLHYIPTSPPSQELDFHLPSRTPLHGLTVSEWAGSKTRHHSNITNTTTPLNTTPLTPTNISYSNNTATTNINKPIVLKDSTEDNWKDVYRNIKCMDQLYDASFYSWLKSEENVLVTAMYLHRIANEYPLVRIINALKWLISDWRLESISTLVRHVTVDWCDEAGDLRRAHLLRHLTQSWATQYTTTLITMVLSSAPYTNSSSFQRERFLRAFTKEWDFSKLSEFFMYLQSPANIDYKVKCVMLQEAARRERETLGAKLRKKRVVFTDEPCSISDETVKEESSASIDTATTTTVVTTAATEENNVTNRRHHRRTSSNDVNDIKRLRLSTPDLDHPEENSMNESSSSSNGGGASRRSTSPHPSRTNNSTGMSNELSHLHLTNVASSSSSSGSNDAPNRRRSSSILSTESSTDDPMETDAGLTSKKRSTGSSITSHFATADEK
ncbi:hypothetical protein MFLAVUS_009608 [Mucor flavus]|uniref:Uncharacterized protein n=1 Tax=Mucor flavus TaxID=439312 RepID=A0ABP9ZAC8_9FUNG